MFEFFFVGGLHNWDQGAGASDAVEIKYRAAAEIIGVRFADSHEWKVNTNK